MKKTSRFVLHVLRLRSIFQIPKNACEQWGAWTVLLTNPCRKKFHPIPAPSHIWLLLDWVPYLFCIEFASDATFARLAKDTAGELPGIERPPSDAGSPCIPAPAIADRIDDGYGNAIPLPNADTETVFYTINTTTTCICLILYARTM